MSAVQYVVWFSAKEVANGPILNAGVLDTSGGEANATVYPSGATRQSVRVWVKAIGANHAVTWGDTATASADGTNGPVIDDGQFVYFDMEAGYTLSAIVSTVS